MRIEAASEKKYIRKYKTTLQETGKKQKKRERDKRSFEVGTWETQFVAVDKEKKHDAHIHTCFLWLYMHTSMLYACAHFMIVYIKNTKQVTHTTSRSYTNNAQIWSRNILLFNFGRY